MILKVVHALGRFGRPRRMSRPTRYLLAVAAVALACAVTRSMREVSPDRELGASSFFLAAVVFVSWYCGLGPGLLAVLLSVVAFQYWFVQPYDRVKFLHTEDEIRTGVFLAVSFLVVGFSFSTRLAHEQLERSRRDLRDFLENGAIGLHWLGPDGSVQWANQAELSMLGYSEDEYIGHHIAEFHANKQAIDDILVRLRRGETLHDYPAQMRTKDGRIRDVLIDSNVLWDEGEFVHSRGFTRDVTDVVRAHNSLIESDARLQAEHAEVQRLYESESAARVAAEQAAGRTAVLQALAAALVEAVTPEDVGAALMQEATGSLGASAGRFMTVDAAQGILRSVAHAGLEGAPSDLDIESDQSRLSIAVREHRAIFVPTAAAEATEFPALPQTAVPAWAAVPVLAGDQVVAVMGFGWEHERAFPPDDIDMMFAFARLAAQALDRAHLYSAERDSRRRAEVASARIARLQAVTVSLSETMTQTEVGEVILREGGSMLGASSGVFALLDRASIELMVTARRGFPRDAKLKQRYNLAESTAIGEAGRLGRPVLVRSREQAARFEAEGVPFLPQEQSWAAIPVTHNDELAGVMRFGWTEPKQFEKDDIELMETLARQTGQALDRSRLFQSEQRARRAAEHSAFSLARLHASRSALARALTPVDVAGVIVREGMAALQTGSGTVHLVSESGDAIQLIAASGLAEGDLQNRRHIALGADLPECQAVREHKPVYSEPTRLSAFVADDSETKPRASSLASVPLMVEERCFGVLTLEFAPGRVLNADEKALIQAFANQGAQAVDRARLYLAEKNAREEAEAAARRVASNQAVTAALAEARTTDDVVEVFASLGVQAAGAWAGTIYLLSDSDQLVALKSSGYLSLEEDAANLSFEAFPQLRRVLDSRKPLFLLSEEDLGQTGLEMAARNGSRSRSWALLPLRHERGTDGLIALSFDCEPAFDEPTRAMLVTLGRLFAQALDRGRLYDAERVLRNRLNAVISDIPGVVWESWQHPDSASQRFDFVSDYVEQMLGYSVEEWTATPNFWASIMHPADRRTALAIAADSGDVGQPRAFEFRWVRKDGRVIHVLAHSSIITGPDGIAAGIRGVALDVSEQKRAEEALRQSELRAQAVLDTAANGIITAGEDGAILTLNAAGERMFGVSAAEVAGLSLSTLIPALTPSRLATTAAQRADGGLSRETPALRKDGSEVAVEVSLSEVRAGDSKTYTAIVNDISERRRARRAIEFLAHASDVLSSSLDYETTLQSLAHLAVPEIGDYCAIDVLEGEELRRVALVHRDGEKIELVRSLEERNAARRDSEEFRRRLRDLKPTLLAEIPPETIDAIPDEERREITRALGPRSAMAVPLATNESSVGLLTFVTAETDRHYDDQDLALATELGRRAGIAIENARLYRDSQRARAELKRSNEAKDEFLGMISHELRTPITSIYGGARFLHLRAGKVDADTQSDLIVTIETESQKLYHLVENLLAIARMELGREIPTEPVILGILVDKVAGAFRSHVPGREVTVLNEAGSVMVPAEPTYIEQVVQNLLSNADKYSPAGAPIDVRVDRREDEVRVAVRDRGSGIAPEELNLIFDSFYRSSKTSATAPGKGLGLTVCKRLIEAQNGRIWARNREGGGLEVGFALPLLDQNNEGQEPDDVDADIELAGTISNGGA
ncbi:MAG TPA: GAF domain-containing protein [Dehalococcoidia bacterium]